MRRPRHRWAHGSVKVRGGTTAYVGRYGATDPEGFVTSWEPLSGVDAQHFEFSDAGDLSFTAVPDFDNPADTKRRQHL